MSAMNRSHLLLALALPLAVACGLGGQPGAAATPSPVSTAQVYHQFAQCVREHGDPDFPDPVVDASGRITLPGGAQKPGQEVMKACVSILDRLPARPAGSADHPDPAMMRQFARCMREHGVDDWPDPDANGRFTLPESLSGNLKSNPRWPEIEAAWNGPCREFDPGGSIEGA